MDRKKSLIQLSVVLLIILIVAVAIKIVNRPPKLEDWSDTNYGDIVVTPSDEDVEVLPENIVDAYGLEYEAYKIPSLGIITFKPIGWEVRCEGEYIYFIAPEENTQSANNAYDYEFSSMLDDDKYSAYKHAEIALCVLESEAINDRYNVSFITEYAMRNLKCHNKRKLAVGKISGQNFARMENKGELIGYYCSPEVNFVIENQPEKGNAWSPYSLFYLLNTNDNTCLFSSIIGPRNSSMQLDEIGKTIAYNTSAYKNTKFDFNTFEKAPMSRIKVGNAEFLMLDSYNENVVSGYYNLSNNPNELTYDCIFYVFSQANADGFASKENLDSFNDTIMSAIWRTTSEAAKDNYHDVSSKNLEMPKYVIEKEESIEIAGKMAKKYTWNVSLPMDANSRQYLDSIMPVTYTSYVIPNGNQTYCFSIKYTLYQKYCAVNFIEKVMQSLILE